MDSVETVECAACGIKNRVRPHSSRETPICGSCRAPLATATVSARDRRRVEDVLSAMIEALGLEVAAIRKKGGGTQVELRGGSESDRPRARGCTGFL